MASRGGLAALKLAVVSALALSAAVLVAGPVDADRLAVGGPPGDESADIDIEVFGLDVMSIDGPDSQVASSDCRGQSRCQSIYLRLSGGSSQPGDQSRTYNIVPVYNDGWPQCVKGDANTPGNVTARYRDTENNTIALSVTVTGGVFDACGYKQSRMRWLVTTFCCGGSRAGSGTVELRKNAGGDTFAQCGDTTMGSRRWRCRRDTSNLVFVTPD